jgi:type II secretory pathway pseudopilin PulG
MLEVMLVVGIIGVLSAITIPAYRDYQVHNDLTTVTEQVTQALGRARMRSQLQEGGLSWGFSVPQGAIFAGKTFATRNAAYDEHYPIPSTIVTSGLSEVTFSTFQGVPSVTGSIVLTSLRGEQLSVSIMIDREGIATNAADSLTLCHCQSNPPHTLNLPESAWPAHQKHGDYLGNCRVPETHCKK